jgi:hypothetical protein
VYVRPNGERECRQCRRERHARYDRTAKGRAAQRRGQHRAHVKSQPFGALLEDLKKRQPPIID